MTLARHKVQPGPLSARLALPASLTLGPGSASTAGLPGPHRLHLRPRQCPPSSCTARLAHTAASGPLPPPPGCPGRTGFTRVPIRGPPGPLPALHCPPRSHWASASESRRRAACGGAGPQPHKASRPATRKINSPRAYHNPTPEAAAASAAAARDSPTLSLDIRVTQAKTVARPRALS